MVRIASTIIAQNGGKSTLARFGHSPINLMMATLLPSMTLSSNHGLKRFSRSAYHAMNGITIALARIMTGRPVRAMVGLL